MHICLMLSIILVTMYCAPINNNSQESILFSENINDGRGNYKFSYSTSNGIFRAEQGTLVNRGELDEHIEVQGSYSYLRPDGKIETFDYTADKRGYQYSTKLMMNKKQLSPALVATLLGK